ncbi:hypothetical protein H8356DRAFT_1663471 [Neocallimastix lanati (nom. inval.)]|jgi:hypothetical protein|uniref:LIM zinc-binding domain-containing protein n=1 Tax=Neocallimastix californiae TaxID=1754190 RepID=A0A1Y2ETK0_9FUNG|nr:hypothetical protein H8356DRAFT_1663471 [Neocallimastix sp. JGI-2020a]ORY74889.1 hypothetical protein LY90DRAFT_666023 [Neocallimastix californiae]|eukprot:ORY74889.1 hypothetical protein LY90DRAFT_666023 [Neocallimastix californiae]
MATAVESAKDGLSSGPKICPVCRETVGDDYLATDKNYFHQDCFVCQQCLMPFADGIYFENDEGVFCEYDNNVLFGKRCGKCGQIILGKYLNAMNMTWHTDHFTCEECGCYLANMKFVNKNGKPFCKPCYEMIKAREEKNKREACGKCKKPIAPEELLILKGVRYHAFHFPCTICNCLLTSDCKEYEGKLYCKKDYDIVTAPVCYTCRRPIFGASITALGRDFHSEHFVCFKCGKRFDDSMFYEYQDKPYCMTHYNELTQSNCGRCKHPASGKVVTALNKKWCENHFTCAGCDLDFNKERVPFYEMDTKPFCKGCYDYLPSSVRKLLEKYDQIDKKVKKKQEEMEKKKAKEKSKS